MNSKEALKILLDGDKVCKIRGSEEYFWFNQDLNMILNSHGGRVEFETFMDWEEYYYWIKPKPQLPKQLEWVKSIPLDEEDIIDCSGMACKDCGMRGFVECSKLEDWVNDLKKKYSF